MALLEPERLTEQHRIDAFRCVQSSLTRWLQERALKNQAAGASNCFVVCDDELEGRTVVAYYSLSAGSVEHAKLPKAMQRNMPDPIPIALLGRLAVHVDYEGQGIGSGLLKDATRRCLRTAQNALGVSALLCHAIDENAKAFYLRHGFVQSPVEDLTVMLSLRGLLRQPG